jgi:hypothetical protein
MQVIRVAAIAIAVAVFFCPVSFTQSGKGSLCVAPISLDWPPTAAPGLACVSNRFSLKIDSQKALSWPTKESVRIDGLDIGVRHRVVIYCDSKPQQSFYFRFSEFNTSEVCLFLNDLYKTAQVWDPKQTPAPWCKCK